ncbi:MAG: tRNA (adenosine(37)-N6)-dimethylallyltransferase MiaA [Desulfovibrio sp.]|nr:tRNA (adenosine(37)-N6)-dimethylallyltransferase MiaA [Desulfovibrio sp.]
MQTAADVYPVLCLAGPTASGKTSLALALATELPVEVINADSRQVYADFPLISAQPTPEERAVCPHHLYGILSSDTQISAGEWRDMALAKIIEVLSRGHVPLLCGGTGMYFQTLLHGIAPIPPTDRDVRARIEDRVGREGLAALHNELCSKDPEYAAKIHPHDRQRIVRALEVLEQTGRTLSDWHKEGTASPVSGPLFVIQASLDWLMPRIEARIECMMKEGALDEMKRAFARAPDPSLPGFSSIGCAELLACARGTLTFEDALTLWIKNTRAYAKRQNTWFRGRKEARFFSPSEGKRFISEACSAWENIHSFNP